MRHVGEHGGQRLLPHSAEFTAPWRWRRLSPSAAHVVVQTVTVPRAAWPGRRPLSRRAGAGAEQAVPDITAR